MRPSYIMFVLAVFAAGIMTGLIIALIIQTNILQVDMIYPMAPTIFSFA